MEARTHRVAAAAYIFFGGKLLLLRRTLPPHTLVPPGGRLEVDEDPVAGMRREVREETGLEVRLIGVAHTWFGRITEQAEPLIAINYLAAAGSSDIRLSDEHSEYLWVTREEIAAGKIQTTDDKGRGYQPKDILDAFDRYNRLTK
ncbi:NUDIX hydrolase [bacterium]|nr:NUDIX hydrolase [bacterium]MBU1920038.1 NUDIX hydrolase [bacterium]RQV98602.1 MAG: NUDIX hydrolase [bacterium]